MLFYLKAAKPRLSGVRRRNVSPASGPRDKMRRLEERLSSQERTTAFLLHQAFRLKDDIVSYLQESTGYQHRETAARQLLENHVQTIAGMVQKLCQDIEVTHAEDYSRANARENASFCASLMLASWAEKSLAWALCFREILIFLT